MSEFSPAVVVLLSASLPHHTSILCCLRSACLESTLHPNTLISMAVALAEALSGPRLAGRHSYTHAGGGERTVCPGAGWGEAIQDEDRRRRRQRRLRVEHCGGLLYCHCCCCCCVRSFVCSVYGSVCVQTRNGITGILLCVLLFLLGRRHHHHTAKHPRLPHIECYYALRQRP